VKHRNYITSLLLALPLSVVSIYSSAQTIGFGNQRLTLSLNNVAVVSFNPRTNGKDPAGITPRNKYPVRMNSRGEHYYHRQLEGQDQTQVYVQSGRRFNITSRTSPILLKSNLPSDRYDAQQLMYLYEILYTATEE
jgi:hypothetical protein